MKINNSFLAFAPLLLLLGCSKNPAENVPAADVRSTTNAAASAAPAATARTFAFGPATSTIDFVGSKVTGSHKGGFRVFAGEFTVVDGRLAPTGHKLVINTSSLWSDTDRLTGHLKSPDFFDVAKHSTSTFESITVEPKGTNVTVTGNLTLHGITKQISFPAQLEVAENGIRVTAEFFLNRNDFEMKYPGKADDLIRQEVVLKLKIQATPGKADFQAVQKSAPAATRQATTPARG